MKTSTKVIIAVSLGGSLLGYLLDGVLQVQEPTIFYLLGLVVGASGVYYIYKN